MPAFQLHHTLTPNPAVIINPSFPCLHIPCLSNQQVRPLPVHTLGLIPYQLEEHRAPLCLYELLSLGPGCQDWPSWGGSGLCLCVGWQQFWAQSPGLCQSSQAFLAHTSGPCQVSRGPFAPMGDFLSLLLLQPCRGSLPLGSFLGPHLRRPRSQVLSGWQRKGRVLCLTAVLSLTSATTGLSTFPFLSAGCSLQTLAGPIAWPWPLQTLCGGLGAAREPWSHCKCFPGLYRCCSASGGPGCRRAGCVPPRHRGNRLLMQAVWAEGPCLCPARPLPCAPGQGEPRQSP